jgi:hypothetical protein
MSISVIPNFNTVDSSVKQVVETTAIDKRIGSGKSVKIMSCQSSQLLNHLDKNLFTFRPKVNIRSESSILTVHYILIKNYFNS